MKLSAFFVLRPVATSLLALATFLTGLVALYHLPVAPMPKMDAPAIMVFAQLPGAAPETMAAAVAAPLERRLGLIPGVDELTSVNTQGMTIVTVQFDSDRDVAGAAHDVQAAINASLGELPARMPSPPTYRKTNSADFPILILAVSSDTLPSAQIYDAADSILAQRLSQVEGVGQVNVRGAGKPAIRIRVDPARMASMGLGAEDVRKTIAQSTINQPKGNFDGASESLSIATNDQLTRAADYAPLIVRAAHGAIVRLSDLGSVADGAENARLAGWYNHDSAVIIMVTKQPNANILETVDRIHTLLPQLQKWLPASVKVSVLMDRTGSIRADVHEVELTLLLSLILVISVVYASLGGLAPTLAASVAAPLSLAATFAVMWMLDYSLDNVTLMALTISTGFVVDDAIVMIENISRRIERGQPPMEAAIDGAGEVSFTIISISLSLVAVFIPALFLGGMLGQILRVFSVTLCSAILASAVVSLTVTPMVYARLSLNGACGHTPGDGGSRRRPTLIARWGEAAMARSQAAYVRGLRWALRHRRATLLAAVAAFGLTIQLYRTTPTGLFPPMDTGMIVADCAGGGDISFQAMKALQQRAADIILSDPDVDGIGSFVGAGMGVSGANSGKMYINLKPLPRRKAGADEIVNRLRPRLEGVEGASIVLQGAQAGPAGGRAGRAQYQFALWAGSLEELREHTPRVVERLKLEPALADVTSDQETAQSQMSVVVDRDAAARLGASMHDVDTALQNAFAQLPAATFYTQRNQYRVVLEADAAHQGDPAALHALYVAGRDGRQIPLDAIARFEPGAAPTSVTHQGQFPSAAISFNLAEGAALGAAFKQIEKAVDEMDLPASVRVEFSGSTKAFAKSMRNQPMLIISAVAMIYIVLGVLYESLIHPLTIISTLPSAGMGALLALQLTGGQLNLMSLLGIILLMGIVKKNGILLVDFAIEARRRRKTSALRAIMAACRQRFRPITMTTLTALLGALPLALASGPSGALRQPLGIAVVGGLVASQLLTLYTTPVTYLALDWAAGWRKRRRARRTARSAEPAVVEVAPHERYSCSITQRAFAKNTNSRGGEPSPLEEKKKITDLAPSTLNI
jgi:multidrug efflux pump